MRMRDVKKLLFAGGEAMNMERSKIKEILTKELGFVYIEESKGLKYMGRLIWDLDDFEMWLEEAEKGKNTYREGMYLFMEIPVHGFYTEIYKVDGYDLFLIHISTGPFEKYYDVIIFDKRELEDIAKYQFSEGYVFFGSSYDLEKVLAKLIKVLNPERIRLY